MTSAASRLSRVSAAIALSFALAAAPAFAAGYLKLGDIKGDVSEKGHGGEIQVESFSWGATQAGTGRGAGKVSVHDISVTKNSDKLAAGGKDGAKGGNVEFEWKVEEGESAPPRPGSGGSFKALVPAGSCKVGTRYPNAEFGTGGRVYQLTGVVVTGCSAARSDGSIPTETLSLNFDKITWK